MQPAKSKKFSNRLKKYRRARSLKQGEVAKILGLKCGSMVSRWENGLCLPRPLTMFKLAVLYRVMVDALFVELRRTLQDEIRKKEEKFLGCRERK